MLNHYLQILGLDKNASVPEIKTAFRHKAKLYHPDINPNTNAHNRFVEINEAYEFLIRIKTLKINYFDAPDSSKENKRHRDKRRTRNDIYEQWMKDDQFKARAKAAYYARMKYEEFAKSNIFKTAIIVNSIFDILFLILGCLIVIMPCVMFFIQKVADDDLVNYYLIDFFLIATGFFMIYVSLKSFGFTIYLKQEKRKELILFIKFLILKRWRQ